MLNLEKRKRGRPATGRSPVIALTVSRQLLGRIDRSADHNLENRRDAVRRLLAFALDAEKSP